MSVFCISLLLIVGVSASQDDSRSQALLALRPSFDDQFSRDTRSDYAPHGDVNWAPGHLTISPGSTVTRMIESGPGASLVADLSSDGDHPEVCVWFLMDAPASCFVRLQPNDGRPMVSLVVRPDGGGGRERTIRETATRRSGGPLTLTYHYGLVRVDDDEGTLFAAYVDARDVRIKGFRVESVSQPVTVTHLRGLTTRPLVALTEEQNKRVSAMDARLMEPYRAGNYAKAAAAAREAVQLCGEVYGTNHPEYALSLGNLAHMLEYTGEYEEAATVGQQSTNLTRELLGDQHPIYALRLNNLAALYESMGYFDRADQVYREALKIRRVTLGEEHPSYATSLNNIAHLSWKLGDYRSAQADWEKCLAIREVVLGKDDPAYARTQANLGMLLTNAGDYVRAEALLRESLDRREKLVGKQHPDYVESLGSLAALYHEMGDHERARTLLTESLQILKTALGDQHPDYARILNNLATLNSKTGQPDEAIRQHKQALAIRKASLPEGHPELTSSQVNLAGVYENVGRYEEAQTIYTESLQSLKPVIGDRHPDYLTTLANLANIHFYLGDLEKAESVYRQVLAARKVVRGPEHPDCAATLSSLAAVRNRRGDVTEAKSLQAAAVELLRRDLNRNAAVQSERQQRANQAQHREILDQQVSFAVDNGGSARAILNSVWQWKGAVTSRQRAYRRAASTPALAPVFADLQSVTRQLSGISRRIPVPPPETAPQETRDRYSDQRKAWQDDFDSLNLRREELEQRIAGDSREYRQLLTPLAVAEVQRLLPEGTAFVDFLEYTVQTGEPVGAADRKRELKTEARFAAFVVRKDREPEMLLIGVAEDLEDSIADFRRPFTSTESSALASASFAGRWLRTHLWEPIEEHLEGVTTVVISPDTTVGSIPFAALPGRRDGAYLLEEYKFACVPLAGFLPDVLRARIKKQKPNALLVVGDVDYNAHPAPAESLEGRPPSPKPAAERRWDARPGFVQELSIVRKQFEDTFDAPVTVLTGGSATETAVLKESSRHQSLHLITHGFFVGPSSDVPSRAPGPPLDGEDTPTAMRAITRYQPGLLSGLVFAGANRPPSSSGTDGILTASEIESFGLGGVDLVVLSACETGLGTAIGGEGLTGLQRAFHVAGARTVVASLWEVDDQATQELMRLFYQNLWSKRQSRLDALRNAQLHLLNNPVLTDGTRLRGDPVKRKSPAQEARPAPQRSAPFYWAAFTLSGDWR